MAKTVKGLSAPPMAAINVSALDSVQEALKEALAWTNSDIRGYDDISPNLTMLKARRKVLRAAVAKAAAGEAFAEQVLLVTGRRGANADTKHPDRALWEAARALVSK